MAYDFSGGGGLFGGFFNGFAPSLQGVQAMPHVGGQGELLGGLQGFNPKVGFSLPESKPFDYMALAQMAGNMGAGGQPQPEQMPIPQAQPVRLQSGQPVASNPLYTSQQYAPISTAGLLSQYRGY